MKKFFNVKFMGALAVGLLVASVAYTQTQFTEVFDILFRASNPQVRATGTVSFRDRAGTIAAPISAARPSIVTTAATRTLLASECGAVIVSNATSGTQIFTLPAISNVGCMFTFIAGDAGTEIQWKTPAVATCVITHFAAVGVDADTAIVTDASCEGGIKNTAATNAIGDSITIISDGTRWLGVGIASGIWAVV